MLDGAYVLNLARGVHLNEDDLLASLDSGKVTSANEYNCGGSYTVNGEKIKCWKSGGHGHETLKKAVIA